ncbi:sulfite exporter TauE/SafE family protein [Endozoicomonadaceae bacterium StTr2]
MDLTLFQLATALGAVFMGALLQGMIGFGLAIVSAPILYVVAPSLVPGSLIMVGLMIALLTLRKYWGSLQLAEMKYAIAGRIPGSLVGAYLLAAASHNQMSLLMGGTLLMAVAVSLCPVNIQATRSSLLAAGVVSGITGTTSSIGGPPIALVMQNETGDRMRAGMSVYFVCSNIISLAFLAAADMFGWAHIKQALLMIPAILLGSWLASKLAVYVSHQVVRLTVLAACSLAGFTAIAGALSG